MLPPVNPMWQPLTKFFSTEGVTKIPAAGCSFLASLLCSYMAGIWSCFCAWNLNSCPWIKWLWNTVWEKCSSEHCKYCHFPVCNVHSSTMQWLCMRVQGVHIEIDNRGRISLYIQIHGTIKKFLTYTGTPLQSMPVWITCNALLQSISSFSFRLSCHPFVIFKNDETLPKFKQSIHHVYMRSTSKPLNCSRYHISRNIRSDTNGK